MEDFFDLNSVPAIPDFCEQGYNYGIISHVLNGWGDEKPYLLIVSKAPFEYLSSESNGERLVWESIGDARDTIAYCKYNSSLHKWDEIQYPNQTGRWDFIILSSGEETYHQIVWSNEDIAKTEGYLIRGSLYPYNVRRIYQLMGFLVGSKTKFYKDPGPWWYKYTSIYESDVLLPPLPQWMDEEYKYAIITHANGTHWEGAPYLLICFKQIPEVVYNQEDGNVRLVYGQEPPVYYKCQDNKWLQKVLAESWGNIKLKDAEDYYHNLIWTSNDIYHYEQSDNIYFSSANPTPVYVAKKPIL